MNNEAKEAGNESDDDCTGGMAGCKEFELGQRRMRVQNERAEDE